MKKKFEMTAIVAVLVLTAFSLMLSACGESDPPENHPEITGFTFTAASGLQVGKSNVAQGAVAGTFSAPEGGTSPFEYSLVSGTGSTDNASFVIGTGDDANKLLVGPSPLTTAKQYSVLVEIADAYNKVFEKICTFTVAAAQTGDEEHIVDFTFTPITGLQVGNANVAAGATIGAFSNPDGGTAPYTYTLVTGTGDTDNGLLTISGTDLKVGATALTAKTYSVYVQVKDTNDVTFAKACIFTVTEEEGGDENNITGFTFTPTADLQVGNDNVGPMKSMGTFSNAVGGTPAYSYSLVSGEGDTDNDLFNILDNTNLWVKSSALTEAREYSVRVQVKDANDVTFAKACTFTVAAEDDPRVDAIVLVDNTWSDSNTIEYVGYDTYEWYKFTPPSDGDYYFHAIITDGYLTSASLRLEKTDRTLVNYESGAWASGSPYKYTLTGGEDYYLGLNLYYVSSSTYTLNIAVNTRADPPLTSDIIASANETNHEWGRSANEAWKTPQTITYTDADSYTWYTFMTNAAGTYYIHGYTTEGKLAKPVLRKPDGTVIDIADNTQWFDTSRDPLLYPQYCKYDGLEANATYYLGLRAYDASSIPATNRLVISTKDYPPLLQEIWDEGVGDDPLTLGTYSSQITLQPGGIKKWCTFTTAEAGMYVLNRIGASLSDIRICRYDGKVIDIELAGGGSDLSPFVPESGLEANTTYFVSFGLSQYSTEAATVQVAVSRATELTAGEWSDDVTISTGNAPASFSFTPETAGTWYLNLDRSAGTGTLDKYTVKSTTGMTGIMWPVRDTAGRGIIAYNLTAGQTYYASFQLTGAGNVTFKTAFMPQFIANGESLAGTLSSGAWTPEASTSSATHYKWYKFTTGSSGNYYFHINVSDGALDEPVMLSSSLNTISWDASPWPTSISSGTTVYGKAYLSAGGTYYLGVRAATDSVDTTYKIAVNQSDTPPAE
ncbi:MAG: hypothetical protein LBM77_09730 [Spirochaetaceae bacterium]|nr:hypothetical protein [Spirochaetaceae bacterium]